MFNFIKQFLIYGFASVLAKIAAVFLLPLYTNALTQEEYGALAMITAVKGIIDIFSNLNIHSGVAREYYEKEINRTEVISTGFFSILFFSSLCMLFMLITKNYWINQVLNIEKYENVFILMLFTIPFGSLFSYFSILTRYKQEALAYSIGNLIQLSLQIGLTIYFILFVKSGIVGVFYGILVGELFGIFYFFFLNREYISFIFNYNLLKRVLKYSIPTLPAIAAIWADSNLGQLLIGNYISLEEAGIYSIALRISSVYLFIQQAFGNVWLPYVYENQNKVDFKKNIMRIYNTATFILLLISVNLSVLAEQIVLILTTPDYINAGIILAILTIPMSITILNQFTSIGPSISRKTKYISYSNITGSVFNLTLLIIFMPFYGVIAVPGSLLISTLIVFLLNIHFTKKEIKIKFTRMNAFIIVIGVFASLLICEIINNKMIRVIVLLIFDLLSLYIIFRKFKVKEFLAKRRCID